ncbi:MAG: hypothetical protein OEM93_05690 [Rhodospirillales bacterium]|nr:hypothetical protein [Rhodospirillales bacterium]MDH3918838.1 hypothetical protein [Rhodospirillales bacterium]MDH3968850.1 hypothetical protein [Rhodospirillales bacterium]
MADPTSTPELQSAAVQEAEANTEWWHQEWLKFPTISLDDDGHWHYWDVPADSGVYSDDWRTGEGLARDTVAQMQRFMAGSSALRRIMHEIDFNSTVAQGFLTRIEDMLANPDLYLDSLEPGSVEAKLKALARDAAEPKAESG